MNLVKLTFLWAILLSSITVAKPKSSAKLLDLQSIVFDKDLWEVKLADFRTKHQAHGFVYTSSSKKELRATNNKFLFIDGPAGEVLIRSTNEKVSDVTISLFNRGDDKPIPFSSFNQRFNNLVTKISAKTGSKPSDISKSSTVDLKRKLWKWENSAILLESSYSTHRNKKTPEFIRIRMKPKNAKSRNIANRSSLSSNVIKDRQSGDIYIDNVPMIDQGQKGYCAVASAARIYRYYGLDIDQHELAQIAGTGANNGTSLGEMVSSLKKVTRHVKSRVLLLYEHPKGLADKDPSLSKSNQAWDRVIRNYNMGLKEFARDVKKYNKIAKKQGKKTFPDDYDTGVVNMQQFAMECDPSIYRDIMMKKSSFSRFNSKIKQYVDQGLPVGWCLQLGMFKEEGIPQTFGGHMRLIIGYNTKTKEIIYTDSWGAGHEKKRMPIADAFCMTTAILALPPTK